MVKATDRARNDLNVLKGRKTEIKRNQTCCPYIIHVNLKGNCVSYQLHRSIKTHEYSLLHNSLPWSEYLMFGVSDHINVNQLLASKTIYVIRHFLIIVVLIVPVAFSVFLLVYCVSLSIEHIHLLSILINIILFNIYTHHIHCLVCILINIVDYSRDKTINSLK